jgi:transcriptional regulator with XRE-family HTH domain
MLSRAERGQRVPSPRAKVLIARRLDVPIRELFELEAVDEDEAVGS